MGDDRPADVPETAGTPEQTEPPAGWPSPQPGWAPPGWAPPGWGGGAPGYGPPGAAGGYGPPGAAGGPPPGWGAPPPAWGGPPSSGWPGYPTLPGGPPGSDLPVRRRGGIVLALVAGALLIAAAFGVGAAILVSRTGSSGTPSGGVSSTPTPSQSAAAASAIALYNKAIQAAEQSAGYHYVATTSFDGAVESVTGDAGQNDGTQVFTEPTAYGSEQFSLRLTSDQTVYFEGNAAALEDQLGVTASSAPGLAGEWISVTIGDGPYKSLEVGITVGSSLSEVTLDATSTQQVTGSGGVTLTSIAGTVPATENAPAGTGHLDVLPSSDLPASYVETFSSGGTTESSTTTFTAWGTAPSVTAPSSPVAWSTLSTSPPPDGYGSGETPSPAPTSTPGAGGST